MKQKLLIVQLQKDVKYIVVQMLRKKEKRKMEFRCIFVKIAKKKFTPLKNTIFENHGISITEQIEFLLDLFNYGSTTLTSKVNKNTLNTSIYWLHRFTWYFKIGKIILEGNIYIDEMFYSVIKSDLKIKNEKKLRGLSCNQHCIGIGYDGNNLVAIVEGLAKTSKDKTETTFISHIKPNSKLIHDDEKSHRRNMI